MKRNRHRKQKLFIVLLSTIFTIGCISIGFSSWTFGSSSLSEVSGDIYSEDVIDVPIGEDLDVITIDRLDDYQFATGYGFVNDGVYSADVYLTGRCTFDSANGKKCFASYKDNNSKSFKLDVELSTSLSGGLRSNGFTSGEIKLESDEFTTLSQDPVDSVKVSTTFVVNCNQNSSDFSFDFSIKVSFDDNDSVSGVDLTKFPDISSASFQVTFISKENN